MQTLFLKISFWNTLDFSLISTFFPHLHPKPLFPYVFSYLTSWNKTHNHIAGRNCSTTGLTLLKWSTEGWFYKTFVLQAIVYLGLASFSHPVSTYRGVKHTRVSSFNRLTAQWLLLRFQNAGKKMKNKVNLVLLYHQDLVKTTTTTNYCYVRPLPGTNCGWQHQARSEKKLSSLGTASPMSSRPEHPSSPPPGLGRPMCPSLTQRLGTKAGSIYNLQGGTGKKQQKIQATRAN